MGPQPALVSSQAGGDSDIQTHTGRGLSDDRDGMPGARMQRPVELEEVSAQGSEEGAQPRP